MSTWDGNNYYYSGQGVVLLGKRGPDGKPLGLVAVGNVSALSVNIETTVSEHKESQTGARGIDKRLTTETKAGLTMTMESFTPENLRIALRASTVIKKGASVVAEALKGYIGKVTAFANMKVSAVALTQGVTPLIVYTNDSTPWDYKLNADAGSILLNDGSGAPYSAAGVSVTSATIGATTTIVVANTLVAGQSVHLYGFTGTGASLVNNKTFTVVSATGANFVIAVDTTALTLTTTTAKAVFDALSLTVNYTYADQSQVQALTEGSEDLYMRFEGLNTAENNEPVVVEIFKFSTDPLQQLALIGDEIQQFELEGNVLADPLQTTGSKFFRQTLLGI